MYYIYVYVRVILTYRVYQLYDSCTIIYRVAEKFGNGYSTLTGLDCL